MLGKIKMKQVLIIITLLSLAGQFSCTTEATSANVRQAEVQEITVARNIGASDFRQFINEKQSAIILDVRTPAEVTQGYISGATNVDINSNDFTAKINQLDKSKPVLVYCRSGRRSAAAMRYMRDNGFSEVYNLNGGIIAWSQAGLPVMK